jgi:hypothetical protein
LLLVSKPDELEHGIPVKYRVKFFFRTSEAGPS